MHLSIGTVSATPGGSLTYTIVAANAGPSDDPSATLTGTFPAVLTCPSGNTAAGSGNLGETLSLPVGSSVTYTIICTIDLNATGTITNTASIAASVTDPTPGNDSATDGDTVLRPDSIGGVGVLKAATTAGGWYTRRRWQGSRSEYVQGSEDVLSVSFNARGVP